MGYYFIFQYLQYLISLLYFGILIQFNSGNKEGVSVSSGDLRVAVSAVMAAVTAVKVRGDGVLFYFLISSIFDIIIIFWYFNSIQQWQ